MTETGQEQKNPDADMLLAANTSETLVAKVPRILPEAPSENHGLVAAIDLGKVKGHETGHMTLLVVDLKNEDGPKWVQGFDIPDGARFAVIDPNREQQANEEGRPTKGVRFLGEGKTIHSKVLVGRGNVPTSESFSTEDIGFVSRSHLDIETRQDGTVVVEDMGSLNHTVIHTGEKARDVVNELGERHEHVTRMKELLGAEAVKHTMQLPAVAEEEPLSNNDGETPESSEALTSDAEKMENRAFSARKLQEILGENNKGGGNFGSALRLLGETPEEIMATLRSREGARNTILHKLRTRVEQMFDQKDASGNPVFKQGVSRERSRDVPETSSFFAASGGKMNSLDYVAALALDMLSGQYSVEEGKRLDSPSDGSHRDAAEKVLADFAKEQVIDKVETFTEDPELKRVLQEARGRLNEGAIQVRQVLDYLERLPDEFRQNLDRPMFNTEEMQGDILGKTKVLQHVADECQSVIQGMNREISRQEEKNGGHFEGKDRTKVEDVSDDARISMNAIEGVLQDGKFDRFLKRLHELQAERSHHDAVIEQIFSEIWQLGETKDALHQVIARLQKH